MLKTTVVEPQKARFTSNNAIIKDHYYYRGNDFKWNQPAAIADKFYPYYHKQKNENKQKIEQLQALEIEDNQTLLSLRREQILALKEQTRARYEQRVKENALIQRKSKQPWRSLQNLDSLDEATIEEETLDVIAKRIDASKHLRSNDISWNHLHKASKKYVDLFLRPICTEREEETMKVFKKKIEVENKNSEEKMSNRAKTHSAIRQIFLNKHEENYEREKKIGLLPTIKSQSCKNSNNISIRFPKEQIPSIHVIEEDTTKEHEKPFFHEPSLNTLDGAFKVKFPSSIPNLDESKMKTLRNATITKLAEPQKEFQKEYTLDHTELNGMLIKNMDYKVYHPGNNFYDALTSNNKFFQKTLEESRDSRKHLSVNSITTFRPKTSSTLNIKLTPETLLPPSTRALSGFSGQSQSSSRTTVRQNKSVSNIPERDEVFSELESFEKRKPLTRNSGFAQVELQNLQLLQSKLEL